MIKFRNLKNHSSGSILNFLWAIELMFIGRPKRSALQKSRCEDIKAWTSVLVYWTVRNFLICLMLYNPRKALLQILPIWTFIRIWASNQDPRFRTLSKGLMRVSSIIIDSIDIFSSCWWVPIIRNSVFASLIIKRLAINQERTSAMHISIAETALISEWIE